MTQTATALIAFVAAQFTSDIQLLKARDNSRKDLHYQICERGQAINKRLAHT